MFCAYSESVNMPRTKARLRKTQCLQCGAILYGSTKALKASVGMTCGCGGRFEISNAEDRELVRVRIARELETPEVGVQP